MASAENGEQMKESFQDGCVSTKHLDQFFIKTHNYLDEIAHVKKCKLVARFF